MVETPHFVTTNPQQLPVSVIYIWTQTNIIVVQKQCGG